MSKIASLKLTNRFYVLGHTLDKANLSYNRPFHQLLLLLGNEARVLLIKMTTDMGQIGFCPILFSSQRLENTQRKWLCYLRLFCKNRHFSMKKI